MVDAGELRSQFASTTGGVMTDEVGAITGELELVTRPTPDGREVEVLVRYAGADEWYRVRGAPVPERDGHEQTHQAILARLTTPGQVDGNELPVDLQG